MASEHELLLWSDDEAHATRAAEAAVADVHRIEAKYTRYRDDSVTTRINRAAGGGAVAIDAETAALLAYADECHRLSGGRFDLTSGVLRRVWDFRRKPPQVPDAAAIEAANRTRYGLAAYVFTNDLAAAIHTYERLEFGMIGVNDWSPQASEAPFAGRKDSGIGHESGREGLLDNLETKLVSFGNVT